MKNQVTKLSKLNIDLDNFYSIRIDKRIVQLQGDLTSQLKSECQNEGFKFDLSDNNWLESTNIEGITITLTF